MSLANRLGNKQRVNNNQFNNQNRQGGGQNRQNRPNYRNNQQNGISTNKNAAWREEVVQRNLQRFRAVSDKKRIAQERYYNQGRSPLVKSTSGPFYKTDASNFYNNRQQQQQKPSIQDRLGNRNLSQRNNQNRMMNQQQRTNNQMNQPAQQRNNQQGIRNNNQQQRQMPHRNNFNTQSNNNNRHRIIRNTPKQGFGGLHSDKMMRVQNVQERRGQLNPHSLIKTVSSSGKIVFLQPVPRTTTRVTRQPQNFTVRIENNMRHNVSKVLNPRLQQEIQMIQHNQAGVMAAPVTTAFYEPPESVVQVPAVINNTPAVSTTFVSASSKTMHERFSSF